MAKLSAVIITLNEQEKVSTCLESIKNLVDEIVLVDSGSTDKTVSIAKRYRAKIFTRKFDNFAHQRNWALEKASGEWILSIDADEVIPSQLAAEIKQAIESDEYNGYLIPRRNFILGAEIKHSWWSPDKHIWLWRKRYGKWVGDVHEEVQVTGDIGELVSSKIHYQDRSIREFISSNTMYAGILAQQMVREGKQFSMWHFFLDPLFEFTIRFIYKKGFLDGWRGFVLALVMAYYRVSVWLHVLRIESGTKV